MSQYHLAQINIARARGLMTDPVMKEFADNLEKINKLGEDTPGFVWRLQTEAGNATDIHTFDDPSILVNLTVWESIEALYQYTYKTEHTDFLRRRAEWFERAEGMPVVTLWWIPAGHIPTTDEAKERIMMLQEHGPTPLAFTFSKRFTVDEMLEHIAEAQ